MKEKTIENKLANIGTMSKETVDFLVFVDQIEIGQVEEEVFVVTETPLGTTMARKGRIPFEVVAENGPTFCEYFKKSVNPKADIKVVLNLRTEDGVEKLRKKVSESTKYKKRDKKVLIAEYEAIHKEMLVLTEKGLKINKNCLWAVYKIMRGKKRRERFEEDGYDIEVLLEENALITPEQMEEIYDRRSEIYDNE